MNDLINETTLTPTTETPPTGRSLRMPKWLWVVLALGALLLVVRLLPINDYLLWFQQFVQAQGAWAPLLYGLVYVICTVLLVPGSILTLGAGVIFGLGWGIVIISLSSTLGATLAFLLARYALRRHVERKLDRYPRFAAIDRAIARKGWLIVLLTRLSPVFPFNLLNYGLGLTKVPFWSYVPVSWIGMLPGTVMFVYVGYVGGQLVSVAADPASAGPMQHVMTAMGLLATVAVTVVITRLARRALDEATQGATDEPDRASITG